MRIGDLPCLEQDRDRGAMGNAGRRRAGRPVWPGRPGRSAWPGRPWRCGSARRGARGWPESQDEGIPGRLLAEPAEDGGPPGRAGLDALRADGGPATAGRAGDRVTDGRGPGRRPRARGTARTLRALASRPGARFRFATPGWLAATARQPWYLTLSRYRWYVSIGAGAGVMALASGVILILPRQPPTAMMTGCGLMPCPARTRPVPARRARPAATAAPRVSVHPAAPPVAPASRITVPAPAPIGSQAATAQPAGPPAAGTAAVQASYRLVTRWSGGIVGEFRIVNEGSTDITSWQLTAAFPGDQIQFIAGAADALTGGDSLALSPSSARSALAPGAGLTVVFTARGTAAQPASCTIDGVACHG